MMYKFYDTCSLLEQAGHLFDTDDYTLVISSITFEELEEIVRNDSKGRYVFNENKTKMLRVGVIGEVKKEDIDAFIVVLKDVLHELYGF